MLEISEQIVAFLKSQSAFADVMGAKIFPIMALEGTEQPFTTYRINDKTPLSKDGTTGNLSVFFWFGPNDYRKMVVFTDMMEKLIKEKSNYEWVSSSPDFIQENFSYVGIINLNTN